MFGDFNFADQVAIYCASIDVHCRNELRNGTITSERDYVSVLSARIRDGLRISGHICHAQTLRQGIEVENGVDGIVLFQFNDEVKVGWYEAKWPRVRQNNYGWDSLHVVRGQSHFSEQIIKQHKWEGIVALWEMFFNEAERGFESPPYEYFGSSCVWHNNTFEFMRVHGKIFESWTTSDLKLLLDGNCIGFYSIIYDILSCRKGKKMLIEKDGKSVRLINSTNKEDEDILEIPIPIIENEIGIIRDNQNIERIDRFMEDRSIGEYLFINLSREKFRI